MLLAARLLLIGSLGGLHLLDDRVQQFGWTFALHCLGTVAFLVLANAALAGRYRPGLPEALGIALLLRLVVLPLSPALSDDVYRYMHEGNMVLAGENPYVTAPADVAQEHRHPVYWERINHKEVPAAYPPAMQLGLAAGALLSDSPLGQKIVFGLCDLWAFVVLWFLLPRVGVAQALAVLYGYCPLMVVEFAGEAHGDSMAVLFLLLSLLLATTRQSWSGGLTLAVATAAKILPAVLLPFLLSKSKALVVAFVLVLVLLYLPFLDRQMFAGTLRYGSEWASNGSIFDLLYGPIRSLCAWLEGHGIKLLNAVYYPHNIAKVPIALFGLWLLFMAWRRRWRVPDVALAFFLFFIATSPTVHPWYLAFLLPFLPIVQSRSACLSLLAFTGTVFFFHQLSGNAAITEWQGRWWLRVLEYVPFYLGIFLWAASPSSSTSARCTARSQPDPRS